MWILQAKPRGGQRKTIVPCFQSALIGINKSRCQRLCTVLCIAGARPVSFPVALPFCADPKPAVQPVSDLNAQRLLVVERAPHCTRPRVITTR